MAIEVADMRNIHGANPDRAKEIWFSVGIPFPDLSRPPPNLTERLGCEDGPWLPGHGNLNAGRRQLASRQIPDEPWPFFFTPLLIAAFFPLCSCMHLAFRESWDGISEIGEVAHNALWLFSISSVVTREMDGISEMNRRRKAHASDCVSELLNY
jgi:hypothetical protein